MNYISKFINYISKFLIIVLISLVSFQKKFKNKFSTSCFSNKHLLSSSLRG